MEIEKLKRCNKLLSDIEECKKQIDFFDYTQYDHILERASSIRFNGSDKFGVIPSSLWRSIGRIVLNEWKQKLNELELLFESE